MNTASALMTTAKRFHGAPPAPVVPRDRDDIPLDTVPEKDRVSIRDGRRMAFFPLPAWSAVPESYVDLRLLWPVKQALLAERVVALSPEGRASLFGHFFTFLTARRLVVPTACPACGTAIDAGQFLKDVRDD